MFIPGGRYPAISKLMLSYCQAFSLQQIVLEPTREENILDLIFTSNPSLVHIVEVKARISDYEFVIVNADLRPVKTRPVLRTIYFYIKKER